MCSSTLQGPQELSSLTASLVGWWSLCSLPIQPQYLRDHFSKHKRERRFNISSNVQAASTGPDEKTVVWHVPGCYGLRA